MLQATLRFDSLLKLWSFKVRVHAHSVVVQSAQRLLICELSETDLHLACQGYSATLIS